jgi:hypothetical protein
MIMAQTPMYNFEEDGAQEAIATLVQTSEQGDEERTAIQSIMQPLIDGKWIGQAANAAFESNEAFLETLDLLISDIARFANTVDQAIAQTTDAMSNIDAITNS